MAVERAMLTYPGIIRTSDSEILQLSRETFGNGNYRESSPVTIHLTTWEVRPKTGGVIMMAGTFTTIENPPIFDMAEMEKIDRQEAAIAKKGNFYMGRKL